MNLLNKLSSGQKEAIKGAATGTSVIAALVNFREGKKRKKELNDIKNSINSLDNSIKNNTLEEKKASGANNYFWPKTSKKFRLSRKEYSLTEGHYINRGLIQNSKEIIDLIVSFLNSSSYRIGGNLTVVDKDQFINTLSPHIEKTNIIGLSSTGVLVLYIKGPIDNGELKKIDSILDRFCVENKNTNYIATKLNNSPGSYIVEIKVDSLVNIDDLKNKFENCGLVCEFLDARNKEKEFSILDDTIAGAGTGATTGAVVASVKGWGGLNSTPNRLKAIGIGTLVGAALGALLGAIKGISSAVSRRNSGSDRMMGDIVEQLKKGGFKEGTHFTRDPKFADRLKTKVAISIARYSGDMKIVINVFSDPKLNKLTESIVKSIPNIAASTQNAKNKFNEFIITTISDGSADAGLIASISERFIRGGYPVYLVEVG